MIPTSRRFEGSVSGEIDWLFVSELVVCLYSFYKTTTIAKASSHEAMRPRKSSAAVLCHDGGVLKGKVVARLSISTDQPP